MTDLSPLSYTLIGLLFAWSGFVRSGLGFGGAVLTLPFLLLIVNDPLIFLPLIAVHLAVFTGWRTIRSVLRDYRSRINGQPELAEVDWAFLVRAFKIMTVPKILGILGLVTLPAEIMAGLIFLIVSIYALGYIVNRPIKAKSIWVERAMLILGAYVSGTSLTGAPLVVPVAANHVAKERLRNTLYVLWLALTTIKLVSFVAIGIDLQLIHHLWLLPCAFLGHIIGEKTHKRLLEAETPIFFRILGIGLLIVSGIGLARIMAWL